MRMETIGKDKEAINLCGLDQSSPLINSTNNLNTRNETIQKMLGKSLVAIDTIPNGLLSFTLGQKFLSFLSWGSLVPAAALFTSTYLAVYSLFSPYLVKTIMLLPSFFIKKCQNKYSLRSTFVFFWLYLVVAILTLNAAYVFSGMKLEGIEVTGKMFDTFSKKSSGAWSKIFYFMSTVFLNTYIKVFFVLNNLPVTILSFSTIHLHFIKDLPSLLYKNIKILFEDKSINKKRNELAIAINNIKNHKLKILPIFEIENIYQTMGLGNQKPILIPLQDKINGLGNLITMNDSSYKTNFFITFLRGLCKFSALVIFFLGTYAMLGNAQNTSKSFGFGKLNPALAYIMSLGTRLSVTAIWFENAYKTLGYLFNSLITRSLGVRVDNNYVRSRIFILSLLAGSSSAMALVHSTLIAINMNGISPSSFLGIVYLLTASFGPTICDGSATFRGRMNVYNRKYQQDTSIDKINKYMFFRVHEFLNDLSSSIRSETSETIANTQFTA